MGSAFNTTTVHPVGLAAVLALGLMMLLAPRRNAVLPLVILVSFVPAAQRVVLAGFDFDFLRLMVLFGWARILIRSEWRGFKFRPIDAWQASVVLVGTFVFVSLHESEAAFIYRLGYSFDAIGLYLMLRVLVRTWDDVERVAVAFATLAIPVAVVFMIEFTTRRNMFSIFGGVPPITGVRDGRLRCQGAFGHPIIAGVFWATILPLLAAAWVSAPRKRLLLAAGAGAILFIVFATSSSTPVASVLLTGVGLAMFKLRRWLSHIRWATLAALVVAHFVLEGPVWSLLAKVRFFGGSTGWHRYNLIDQAIKHIGEWWLLGTETTAHWGNFGQLLDITNQYVFEGVNGGIWTLLLFVGLIVVAFRTVGGQMRATEGRPRAQWLGWCLGVMVFVHAVNFIALTYFAQMIFHWLLTLAVIGSIAPARRAAVAAAPRRLAPTRTRTFQPPRRAEASP